MPRSTAVVFSPADFDAEIFAMEGEVNRTAGAHAETWKKVLPAFLPSKGRASWSGSRGAFLRTKRTRRRSPAPVAPEDQSATASGMNCTSWPGGQTLGLELGD